MEENPHAFTWRTCACITTKTFIDIIRSVKIIREVVKKMKRRWWFQRGTISCVCRIVLFSFCFYAKGVLMKSGTSVTRDPCGGSIEVSHKSTKGTLLLLCMFEKGNFSMRSNHTKYLAWFTNTTVIQCKKKRFCFSETLPWYLQGNYAFAMHLACFTTLFF